jgi:hypothetical protein
VSPSEALVGLGGIDELKGFRDRNRELRRFYGPVESREFSHSGFPVIRK